MLSDHSVHGVVYKTIVYKPLFKVMITNSRAGMSHIRTISFKIELCRIFPFQKQISKVVE